MNIVKKSVLGAVAALAITSAAQASLFQINPVISASYDPATGALKSGALNGPGLNPATPNVLPTGAANTVYAIDLYVKYTPSLNEPSFGNMTFDIVDGGTTSHPAANVSTTIKKDYTPVGTLYDADADGTPDTPYFGQNADAGLDLKAVLLGLDSTTLTADNGDGDPRRSVGQASNPNFGSNPNGFRFGRIFVNSGGGPVATEAFNLQPAGSGSPPSTLDGKTLSNPVDAAILNGLAIITVPEPTTMLGLAAVAGLALARRRRD